LNKLPPEEIRRRIRIYNEGGEVKDMAKKAGLNTKTFASWMWVVGLPAHKVGYGKPSKQKPRKTGPQLTGIKGDPYVHKRPAKERKLINEFTNKLIETYDRGINRYKKPNVRKFINEYRSLYGGSI